jgi:GNAT superfamily N-acetyltransferase
MVFWKTYPISNVVETIYYKHFSSSAFIPQPFEKQAATSPTGQTYQLVTPEILPELHDYIKRYFGEPPTKPILDIPVTQLLSERDHLLFVRDAEGQIAGTIRYHYIGQIKYNVKPGITWHKEMYCVDCFCIHPQWKRKGVGDYLLTELHHYVNKWNIPYSVFLKEGHKLSIVHPPLYSGMYVYKKIDQTSINSKNSSKNTIPIKLAYNLIEIWQQLYPVTVIITNQKSPNQLWKMYKKGRHIILACIQDAYQRINNKKIGWITGWLESPEITDDIRTEASNEIADSVPFDYIWMNRLWTTDPSWKEDGSFYWYSYQWTTSHVMDRSYCIMN